MGAYAPGAYHQFIGFQVATPLVERAFRETYEIEMKDVLTDEDLAISAYRRAVSELIPELTRAAWRDKHDEIWPSSKRRPRRSKIPFVR